MSAETQAPALAESPPKTLGVPFRFFIRSVRHGRAEVQSADGVVLCVCKSFSVAGEIRNALEAWQKRHSREGEPEAFGGAR